MRRLTVKRETTLLKVRDWPEEDMKLTTGSKIRCSDRAEEDEDTVVSSDTPASSADKKQSEKL
ncbi:hypothetical protein BDFG_03683 [Blastomyces dermatitidis ATCC 26199]|nr:hypothetical protein BDFG_03683 [Blastomyces dermatitidis ATCC 26199]